MADNAAPEFVLGETIANGFEEKLTTKLIRRPSPVVAIYPHCSILPFG